MWLLLSVYSFDLNAVRSLWGHGGPTADLPASRLQGRPVSRSNVSIIPTGPPPAALIIDSVAFPLKKGQSQNSFSFSDKDRCSFGPCQKPGFTLIALRLCVTLYWLVAVVAGEGASAGTVRSGSKISAPAILNWSSVNSMLNRDMWSEVKWSVLNGKFERKSD